MTECQYTKADLIKAIPLAQESDMGEWSDIEAATREFNRIIALIHNEHPYSTEQQITDAVLLGNAAYERFCETAGDFDQTAEFVRSRI